MQRLWALERYKAAKHHVKLVLLHLRNVYREDALAQVQRHAAQTGTILPGFEGVGATLQETG